MINFRVYLHYWPRGIIIRPKSCPVFGSPPFSVALHLSDYGLCELWISAQQSTREFRSPENHKKHKEKYFKFCVMRRDQRQERVCWISAKNWVLFMVTEKWARQKRRFWLIENIDSRFPAVISPVSLSLTYFLLTTKINEIRRLRALQVTFILV